MFIVSVLLFLKFRIISVIGDLTGRTAQKQIERFREGNLRSGDKKYKPSPVNLNRGRLTESFTGKTGRGRKTGDFAKTGNTYNPASMPNNKTYITSEINTKNIPTDVLLTNDDITEQMNVLSNETDVIELADNTRDKTAGLQETDVLGAETETETFGNGTEVLTSGTEVLGLTGELSDTNDTQFTVLKSIIIIHTDEVI
jgi:hypothetical protein